MHNLLLSCQIFYWVQVGGLTELFLQLNFLSLESAERLFHRMFWIAVLLTGPPGPPPHCSGGWLHILVSFLLPFNNLDSATMRKETAPYHQASTSESHCIVFLGSCAEPFYPQTLLLPLPKSSIFVLFDHTTLFQTSFNMSFLQQLSSKGDVQWQLDLL